MTYFDNYFGEGNSQNSYYDHIYTDDQSFSYYEGVNEDGVSYDYYNPYQVNYEPEYVPQSYQIADPITFPSPSYYIEVPQVFATEIGGTMYYHYHSLYYPVYSTPDYAADSYDGLSTTISSSISSVIYSESISSPMDSTNSLNNTTEINYTNVQVSNIVFENGFSYDWHNNSQINTESHATDYNYRNAGISGNFEDDNSTAIYNGSSFSQVNSSMEASNIQFESDSKARVKFLKDRLYILALSGKLYLKDSVPVVDILPVIEEESNLIEDDNNLRRPGEEPEISERKSLTVEKNKELGLTYKKSASNETREVNSIATKAKFKNVDSESKVRGWEFEIEGENFTYTEEKSYCKERFSYDSRNRVQDWTVDEEDEYFIITNDKCDFLENVNSDSQTNVPDWTVEVEDGISDEEYDVTEHLNQDSENTVLDWTTEVEEENDYEKKYEDFIITNDKCDFLENLNSDSQTNVPDWTVEVEDGVADEEYDVQKHLNQDSENTILDWTTEVEEENAYEQEYADLIITNDKCDFLENVNSDSETNVPDWTVEVEDGISDEEYDVKEYLNHDSEKTILDWTTEVEEENDYEQEYEDHFYKIDGNSSPSNIDKYKSKEVTEYRKEQLYISALSGYMSLKEHVPIVDILPVIEEEPSSIDDNDYVPDLKKELEKEKPLYKEEIYKEIDHVKEESKLNEPTKYLSVKIDTKVESAEIDSSTEEYNSLNSTKEIEKNEETLIESSKSAVQTHQSDMQSTSNNEIKVIETEEKNTSEVKKKRFQNIRKWHRSLCCCMKNEPN